MTKTISLFLSLAITIILVGACNGNSPPETTTTQTTTTVISTTTSQHTTSQPNTTTSSTTSSSGQTNMTLTKTATNAATTPTNSPEDQIREALIDIFVPEFKPVGDPIPILLTFTNPIDSQWSCNIPITFTNIDDENQVVIWVISVSLAVNETRDVLVEGIAMGEGRWKVKAGLKTREIFTS
ncbi:MAG: hypothetical protein JSV74_00040 [Dehalococcoidia bacterium]|nr:MAG: hypothetical protein JSV74_00040 [Dehalococcoidia bacterium]